MTSEQELNEKWSIHSAIQSAIESAHNTPAPQTIKMFDEMRNDLKDIRLDIKNNTFITTEIDKKVAVANGRTGKLEDASNDMRKTMETLAKSIEVLAKAVEKNKDEIDLMKNTHKSDVMLIVKVVSVAVFFIGVIVFLAWQNIKYANEKSLQEQSISNIKASAQMTVDLLKESYILEVLPPNE